MAVITFFLASLPAFHAQWKLASGRGLIYRVAEKGSRNLPVVAHGADSHGVEAEAIGVASGGQQRPFVTSTGFLLAR